MKVLVCSQYYWPETFRITEVVQSLREAGCDVTVLTGQPNYPVGAVYKGYSAASSISARCGPRISPPGVSPVHVPFANVTTPLLIVAT